MELFAYLDVYHRPSIMPGTKSRTKRRPKRKPPTVKRIKTDPSACGATLAVSTSSSSSTLAAASTSSSQATSSSATPPTASQKKLSYLELQSNDSDDDLPASERGRRIFELPSLQEALYSGVCCSTCHAGDIELKEDSSLRQGLYTAPYLYCSNCQKTTPISFSVCGPGKTLAVNRCSAFANKCIGGTHPSLSMFFAMLDLPPPVARCTYSLYTKDILGGSAVVAQKSMEGARHQVRDLAGASEDEVVDVLVSCDGTWQKRGFSSLFGAVFLIAHTTGKVIDYHVMSKVCAGCKHWESRDQSSPEYQQWKESHAAQCSMNFDGSAPAMEPHGTLQLFQRSLQYNLRYTHLISDGDSKTFSLLSRLQPYGQEHPIQKLDCVGHVQKRLGTALRNLKVTYRGRKLDDGKTIGGAGRLTDGLINSLQNYYGDAIRQNKGDLQAMVRAVQASLLHTNSSDDHPRHHLCPTGERSWCGWQRAQAKGEIYHHQKKPLPSAIVQLLKPVYTRLGNPELLKKCLHGYHQNANESLHSLVWRFCPKVLHMGSNNVELACALAVMCFNNGSASLANVCDTLKIPSTEYRQRYLRKKDRARVRRSILKSSTKGKKARRAARRRKKGYEDKKKQSEGLMYSAGAFDSETKSV